MISNQLYLRIFSSIIMLLICFYLIIEGSISFNIFLLICFFISINEWSKFKIKKSFIIFGYLFLLLSFFSVFLLRSNYLGEGLFYVSLITTICVSSDIGGFFAGKIFKGPKITKISPNKTYSGVIGAYLMTIFLTYLFYEINNKDNLFFSNFFSILIISTASQIGDIIVSYFKRLSNIKDTGNIIPGHGGILDRIDGMIFAFPLAFLIFL